MPSKISKRVDHSGEDLLTICLRGDLIMLASLPEEIVDSVYNFSVSSFLVLCKTLYQNQLAQKTDLSTNTIIKDHSNKDKNPRNNMASLNKVFIMGNLTRDPEIKYTPKGTAIAEIGLAVNHNYTTDSGEKREDVTFIDCTLWGRVAEIVGEYCKKGRPLLVEGRLQLDTWDDKQTGQKRSKLKVVGDNVQLLGGAPKGEAAPEDDRPA